ncbi:hypothetical protein [Lacisediminihabitans sp. H27-G8]|uniref:hypothetical protein n=1 Tax=Lacisediminihabitans sp. H27-G8 TaxID=3111909 RepID=UPI0038FD2CFD
MSTEYPSNNVPDHDAAATTPLFDEITHTHPEGEQTDTSGNPAVVEAESAKGEAKAVAGDAKDAARDVADSAKDKVANVASEAKGQAKNLLEEATSELREQAGTQKKRAAEQLHSVGEQLTSMADSSEDNGPAVDLVRNLGGRAGAVASWLGDRDTDQVLADVRKYASHNPGTFIGIAAVAGILAGRLSKSLVTNAKDDNESSTSASAENSSPVSEAPTQTSSVHAPSPQSVAGGAENSSVTSASDRVSSSGSLSGDSVYGTSIDFDRRGDSL